MVAILGSGGGFRAMVGFSGVMKALYESGILDCATYVAGLSGSTWLVCIFDEFEFYFSKGSNSNIRKGRFKKLRRHITKAFQRDATVSLRMSYNKRLYLFKTLTIGLLFKVSFD